MKIKILKSVAILLIGIILISSYFIIKQLKEEKKQDNEFIELEEIIKDDVIVNENTQIKVADDETNNVRQESTSINLQELYKKNNDLVGWIKIDGTNINYPVMQNGDYYLHKNFYKEYSSYGVPYIASYCNIETTDNLIIYGHHIKNGKMFANLEKYKNYSFYKDHKKIKLYLLSSNKSETIENTYEIVFAFKTVADESGFKYYNLLNTRNEQEYNNFVKNCSNLSFYNTEIKAEYGDKLITLSTCEYSQDNGRMVVVAKKV